MIKEGDVMSSLRGLPVRVIVGVATIVVVSTALGISGVISGVVRGDIISYNFETVAKNVPIASPTNLNEVQNLIKTAARNGNKIRFSGASHSTSSLILGQGIYLKSDRLNRIHGIKVLPGVGPVVEAEAGVRLGDLANYLATRGFSLGFAYPFYHGVTIAGLISTGSHGSSRMHSAVSSQNVVGLTMVNGLGEVVEVNQRTPEMLKAARVSLGLLGFIYKVQLKIIPDFKLTYRARVLMGPNALLSRPGLVSWGPVADSEYVYWFPAEDRAIKIEGIKTQKPVSPGAQLVVLGQEPAVDPSAESAKLLFLRKAMNDPDLFKTLEDKRFADLASSPPPFVLIQNGKEARVNGVVGRSSAMLISKRIPPNPVITGQDFSFAFPIENAPAVMGLIHQFSKQKKFYHGFLSVFLRFARADGSSYLSHVERDSDRAGRVFVLAEFFEAKGYTEYDPPTVSSRLRDELLFVLAQSGLVTFHWGKNKTSVFALQANQRLMKRNMLEFERVRRQMDPRGIFVNAFAEQFLAQ